jgi:hypothetical protein
MKRAEKKAQKFADKVEVKRKKKKTRKTAGEAKLPSKPVKPSIE